MKVLVKYIIENKVDEWNIETFKTLKSFLTFVKDNQEVVIKYCNDKGKNKTVSSYFAFDIEVRSEQKTYEYCG